MDLILAVLVYPILLLALAVGTGLMVERASAWQLPPALLPATGIAALIGLTQLTTSFGATAPATPWLVLAAGAGGLVVCRTRLIELSRAGAEVYWPLVAFAAAFAVAIAPVAMSGSVTLTSYLLDTTSAVQLLGAEQITAHGRHLDTSAPTAANAYMQAYFGLGYPAGSHTLLGGTGRLVPIELIWLYQPFLAFMQALAAPVLWHLARRIFGFGRGVAAVIGMLAAIPALVYAYQLMGSIKEIVALPVMLLLWALVIDQRLWLRGSARAVIPLGLVAAAGVGAIGAAFVAWIAAAAAVLTLSVVIQRPRLGLHGLLLRVGVIAMVGVIAALQTIRDLPNTAGLANSISESNQTLAADPGNLLRPLRAIQALGIWVSGDHRIDPSQHATATYLLLGVALIGIVAGAAYLLRRGAWTALLVFGLTGVIWWALTRRGTNWTDAKMIMLTSSLAVLLALGGLGTLLPPGRRVESVLLVGAVAFGIAWSDAILYHERNLAPAKRFEELASIGSRFDGQGPALFTDFDEYAMVLAYGLDPDQPGFARHSAVRVGGQVASLGGPYGTTADLDQIDWQLVEQFPLVVQRRSPEQSRPPSNYSLAWRGKWFDVWRRVAPVSRILQHIGAYADGTATGAIGCGAIREAARAASQQGAQLAYAMRGPVVRIDPQRASRSPNWQGALTPIGIGLSGPGRLDAVVRLPLAGRWLLWLRGDISRPLSVYLDGRRVGSLGRESGGDRNYLKPLALPTAAGQHRLRLVRGGGSLAPGDGAPSVLRRIAFELPLPPGREVVRLAPSKWRDLCGRQIDWLEVISA